MKLTVKRHFIRKIVLICIVFLCLNGNCFSEPEEDLPKVGFVRNNGSNVRAGGNINFESLCKLEKGDPVKIIGKSYSWFKIVLPKKAHLYIKSDYVDIVPEEEIGVVNAQRVNLRAGPDTKYSILGQVSRRNKLNVLEEKDGWYEIEPPDGIAGWINESQLMFSLEKKD